MKLCRDKIKIVTTSEIEACSDFEATWRFASMAKGRTCTPRSTRQNVNNLKMNETMKKQFTEKQKKGKMEQKRQP